MLRWSTAFDSVDGSVANDLELAEVAQVALAAEAAPKIDRSRIPAMVDLL